MLPHSDYSWYRLLTRVLLGYLVLLYLVGFSWHLSRHNRLPASLLLASHSSDDPVVLDDDPCVLCDWLIQDTYSGSGTLAVEDTPEISASPLNPIVTSFFNCFTGQNEVSRGPPSLV